MIEVLIPTFRRPQRLMALARNIAEATRTEHRVWFVAERDDAETIDACRSGGLDVIVNERTANYAGAVNTAYELTDGAHLFCGADDLVFHDGWDEKCVQHMDDWIGVVGTNDLLNPYVLAGTHSTHSLVARWYLDRIGGVVDQGPGSFLPECYDHNFTDTEFVGTAKMRARFRPCLEAVVEHLHVSTGRAPHDETHDRSMRDYAADDALYESRRELWWRISR